MSPEIKIHLFYAFIFVGYLLMSAGVVVYFRKCRDKNLKKEISIMQGSFVELVDHMNYVASENMRTLEEKTIELRDLLEKIEHKEIEINALLKSGNTVNEVVDANVIPCDKMQISSPYNKMQNIGSEINNEVFQETMRRLQNNIIKSFNENLPESQKKEIYPVREQSFHDDRIKGSTFENTEKVFTEKKVKKSKSSQKYDKIIDLSNRGYSIEKIAAETKFNKGQIKLYLSIHEPRK
ncbi:hypothetical protein KAJ27_15245 [bacterium]|nr:hypothetical protein [bacterium]